MPRKKRKSKDEKEPDYIPVNPEDIKKITKVPVKTFSKDDIETVEKIGTKKSKLMTRAKQGTRKKGKVSKDKQGKFARKPGLSGYLLIITEKPQAAAKIAAALGNAKRISAGGSYYFELEKSGKKIIVACAVGHLFTLTQTKKGLPLPVFNIEWVPNFEAKKQEWSKKYYNLLEKLCKNAKEFIVATDYDIEGEVIGLNIIRFLCNQKDAKRMKFSTLTDNEINNAYKNLMPTLDWGQAIAGETRHYLDWMYGINLSRAIMNAIKKAGSFRIMSVGRVQGPALHLVVEKELEIQKFKSKPYWQIFIELPNKIQLKYIKDITNKKELAQFKKLKSKEIQVKTEKTEQKILPPHPFDLTTLQTEAYKFYGITPSRTLQIAQRLYLSGIISYPRTSSQKIPQTINPKTIIKKLSQAYKETKLCIRKYPIEGRKSDPAHPSIYPTGNRGNITTEDKKIYELVVRRFLSCFCQDALVENKKIQGEINKLRFITKGIKVKEKGWMQVYRARLDEKSLPDINEKKKIKDVKIQEKETQPPKRYSPASLVSELTKRNLGTKATRAAIVETLYNREYIEDRSIKATSLGISLIQSLEKNSPIIINEKLTRQFEQEMESIKTAKHNLEKKENKVIGEAKQVITKIIDDFNKNEQKIGKALIKANNYLREKKIEVNTLNKCPKCGKGNLTIKYNRKSRRYFIACNAYPKCKTTFSLPPNSLIKPADKTCQECTFPKLLAIKRARRPWEFCFNPECKTNLKRGDEI